MEHWYLIRLRADKIFKHESLMRLLGLESVHPIAIKYRYKSRADRSRRSPKKAIKTSLLGGYMWIRGPSLSKFWQIMWALDLIDSIDGYMGCPRAWSDEAVQEISARYPKSDYTPPDAHKFMRSWHEFEAGDIVTIHHPAMAGIAGKVVDIRENVTKVSIQMLGGVQDVSVATSDLEKIS